MKQDIAEKLRNVASRVFQTDAELLTPSSSREEVSGWDSMGHLTLVMEVEREFTVRFTTSHIEDAKSLNDFAEIIGELSKK